MPLLETKGVASAQGFGLTLQQTAANYIESCFSTFLYTGNGSTQTITNGIDLAGKGGLVWSKGRNNPGYALDNALVDTARGASFNIFSNTTGNQTANSDISAFGSTGYSFAGAPGGYQNNAGNIYVSWTFRKQPKFFDVVTYTGNGNYSTDTPAPYGRSIAHSLGSRPGFIVIKATSTTSEWYVGARQNDTYWMGSFGTGSSAFRLNGTGGAIQYDWATRPMADASSFFPARIGANGSSGTTNDNGVTYVAYLFAHDAGGFGLTGTDNVISCGSFTTNGSGNATVNLGYEPQWVMVKASSEAGNWDIIDNMRGFPVTGDDRTLRANLSNAEANLLGYLSPTATGFSIVGSATATYVYIAIRRGPMRTPTSGSSVFNPVARTGTGTNPTTVTTNTNPDLLMSFPRTASPDAYGMCFWDKLRGVTEMLQSSNTSGQTATSSLYTLQGWLNTGYQAGADFISGYLNYSGSTYVNYPITRAPGFFDEVCYTGNGSNSTTVTHNLAVAPELIIAKARNLPSAWRVGAQFTSTTRIAGNLNTNDSLPSDSYTGTGATLWTGQPTATAFTPGLTANASGTTYVAYLFASCPGVSKVGSYTGTGALQTIDCGFPSGARFVLIKRTNTSGSWFVWDTARGMVAGTDPALYLNSTNAEFNANSVYTTAGGFQILASPAEAINTNGATYIYLAIA